jgi:hypothetical protein
VTKEGGELVHVLIGQAAKLASGEINGCDGVGLQLCANVLNATLHPFVAAERSDDPQTGTKKNKHAFVNTGGGGFIRVIELSIASYTSNSCCVYWLIATQKVPAQGKDCWTTFKVTTTIMVTTIVMVSFLFFFV